MIIINPASSMALLFRPKKENARTTATLKPNCSFCKWFTLIELNCTHKDMIKNNINFLNPICELEYFEKIKNL